MLSFWYQVHCPDTVTYDWATGHAAGQYDQHHDDDAGEDLHQLGQLGFDQRRSEPPATATR